MQKIYPDEKTSKGGHYSPAILSNGILYISGQLAINPESGELAEDSYSLWQTSS